MRKIPQISFKDVTFNLIYHRNLISIRLVLCKIDRYEIKECVRHKTLPWFCTLSALTSHFSCLGFNLIQHYVNICQLMLLGHTSNTCDASLKELPVYGQLCPVCWWAWPPGALTPNPGGGAGGVDREKMRCTTLLALLTGVILYLVMGALIFSTLEAPDESQAYKDLLAIKHMFLDSKTCVTELDFHKLVKVPLDTLSNLNIT